MHIPHYLRVIESNVLVLIDTHHPEDDSLTNSLRNVIPLEAERLGEEFAKLEAIIYSDSFDRFDGVKYYDKGRFVGFYPIGETDMHKAIAAARSRSAGDRSTL